MPQRIFMNAIDAEARGIKDGDRVRIFNNYGEIMMPVRVNSRIIPGVVDIPEGGWYTPDENGIDQRGCVNVLTTYKWTPGAKGNPQHTIWVDVEKV
ncbi:MAG: molybdopterin dinucleotide binding domain-containing protein [Anaerolineales bacterium]